MTSLVEWNDQSIIDTATTVYLNASNDTSSVGNVRMNGTDFQFFNGTDWKTVSTT